VIICGECGARNDDGVTFCGSCGKYLAFVGEPGDRPEAAAEPKTVSEPAAHTEPAASAEPVSATAPGSPVATGSATSPTTAVSPAQAEKGRDQSDVEPLLVPVEAGPASTAGAPVLPGAPGTRPRPAPLPPDERKVEPGELICGQCGAGNVPTRRFCRRCGSDLVDAQVQPEPPWWRRLLRAGRGRQRRAGERPRRVVRRSYRGKVVFLLVLSLLVTALWTQRAPLTRLSASVVDRVSDKRRVEPAELTASSSVRGHGYKLLRDGKTYTFWAPGGRNDGSGQYVDVRFATPIRLVAVVVFNGASRELPEFLAQSRPQTLRFTFSHPAAPRTERDVVLKDEPRQQDVFLGVDEVSRLRITVVDVKVARPGALVALAELQFYER
jgi:ribosomal protein L40E